MFLCFTRSKPGTWYQTVGDRISTFPFRDFYQPKLKSEVVNGSTRRSQFNELKRFYVVIIDIVLEGCSKFTVNTYTSHILPKVRVSFVSYRVARKLGSLSLLRRVVKDR